MLRTFFFFFGVLNLKIWQIRIPVSTEFLETIETNVVRQRPVWRVDAAKVDSHCDSVLLLSDHSLFPSGSHNLTSC